jgi:hypothetical protein
MVAVPDPTAPEPGEHGMALGPFLTPSFHFGQNRQATSIMIPQRQESRLGITLDANFVDHAASSPQPITSTGVPLSTSWNVTALASQSSNAKVREVDTTGAEITEPGLITRPCSDR